MALLNPLESAQQTKWYPFYHVAPPYGWLNDPNGFCWYNGEYHIFYQYHPFSTDWGPMHWGHSTSKDFCHWTHQPIAITPGAFSEGHEWYDWDGCFSGCGVEFEGKLWLMYTSQRFNGAGGVNSSANPSAYNPSGSSGGGNVTERQCYVYSEDGIHFTKYEKNPVIDIPNDHPIIANIDFRDPKIWDHNGKYYCAIGNRIRDRSRTQIVLFESENFFDWTYKSVVAISKPDYSEGTMWECPGFAHFGDKYVMIISPQHVPPKGYLFHNIHQAGYMVGTLDYDQGVFTHGDFYTFDYGFDFYATTMMKHPDTGRYFIIAWLAAWQSRFCEQPDGWANLLTIPRELKMREDGKVLTSPPDELKDLRKEHFGYQNVKVDKPTKLHGVKGSVGELIVNIDTKQAFSIELRVGEGETVEKTIFSYEPNERLVILNRDQAGAGDGGTRKFVMDPCENMEWRFYLDRSSIELFINDGEYAMTTRVYPRTESDDIVFVPAAEGQTVEFKSVDYYSFV